MLVERVKLISDETSKIKADLIATIKAKTPEKQKLFTTIKVSELDMGIWSADHYDTNYQLNRIVAYLENSCTLEGIVNCFKSIVETGKAQAFDRLIFNAEARKVLNELL